MPPSLWKLAWLSHFSHGNTIFLREYNSTRKKVSSSRYCREPEFGTALAFRKVRKKSIDRNAYKNGKQSLQCIQGLFLAALGAQMLDRKVSGEFSESFVFVSGLPGCRSSGSSVSSRTSRSSWSSRSSQSSWSSRGVINHCLEAFRKVSGKFSGGWGWDQLHPGMLP